MAESGLEVYQLFMPLILFLYLYFGKTWFQIEKYGRNIDFFPLLPSSGAPSVSPVTSPCNFCPILSYFSFSFNPPLQISSQHQALVPPPESAVLPYSPDWNYSRSPYHLQPSSPHPHHPLTLQRSILDSSFSALTLKITMVGQIVLLKKTTGCNWRRNKTLQRQSEKMQKGG